MSRLFVPVASLVAMGGLLLAPTTAQASTTPASAAQASASTSASGKVALTTRVKVSSPSAIRRGGAAHYTFTVTRPDQVTDRALVLETDFPRGIVSKVRFTAKPRGASCGVQKRSKDGNYAVYCIVRSLNHSKITMSFRAWIKPSYHGKYRVGHYWGPVTPDSGGSVQDYLDYIGKHELIGHAWTKVV
jgi:hypothetical protein